MQKQGNWHVSLHQYMQRVIKKPFAWGEFDCCIFAADAVQSMTGVDLAAGFRGKYHDYETAKVVLRDIAGGGISAAMAKLAGEYGWEEICDTRHIMRGDIVMGNQEVIPPIGGAIDGTLGICVGTISLFSSTDGLAAVSTLELPGEAPNILRAWRIKTATG